MMRKSYALYHGSRNDWPRGDCMRATVASILNKQTLEVPHFAGVLIDDTEDDMWRYFQQWLKSEQLMSVTYLFKPTIQLLPIQCHLRELKGRLLTYEIKQRPLMIIGQSRSDSHCAVYQDGEIVHDPSCRTGTALIGPISTGFYHLVDLVPHDAAFPGHLVSLIN